jgi:nucleolar complex protein 2
MISVRDLEHVASDEEDVDEEEKRSRRKSKKSGKVVAREHKDQLQRLKEKVRYALFSKDDMFC